MIDPCSTRLAWEGDLLARGRSSREDGEGGLGKERTPPPPPGRGVLGVTSPSVCFYR